MSIRMPSLSALRAFEATIRCGGLTEAALELAVTPSAISHQIRQLEHDLGVKLVRRSGRRLALTDSGRRLVPGLHDAFARLYLSIGELHREEQRAPVRISMLQNFAINWFLPRLDRLQQRHPDIEIHLSLSSHYVDFAREEIDMAIRHGAGQWPELHCVHLFQDQLTPVCSPAFLARYGPLAEPSDLIGHRIIVSTSRPHDAWGEWFKAFGIEPPTSMRELRVETSHLALQAAANGIGIAICGRRLMQPMLDRQAVVAPFPLAIPEHGSFFVISPREWTNRPKIRVVRQWLLEEASETFHV